MSNHYFNPMMPPTVFFLKNISQNLIFRVKDSKNVFGHERVFNKGFLISNPPSEFFCVMRAQPTEWKPLLLPP